MEDAAFGFAGLVESCQRSIVNDLVGDKVLAGLLRIQEAAPDGI